VDWGFWKKNRIVIIITPCTDEVNIFRSISSTLSDGFFFFFFKNLLLKYKNIIIVIRKMNFDEETQ